MIVYFVLFTYIYSCILRKKEHCLDYKLFKDGKFSDYLIETFVNSENVAQNETAEMSNLNVEIIDLTGDQPECKRSKYDLSETDCTRSNANNFSVKSVQSEHLYEEIIDTKIENIIRIYHEFDKVNLTENYKKFISGDMENLNEIIQLFLKKFIKQSYIKKCILRIESLEKAYKLLNIKEKKFFKSNYLFDPSDKKFLETLEKLVNTFDLNSDYSKEEYHKFIVQLDEYLTEIEEFNDCKRHLKTICFENKRYLYFNELINCAKFFVSFPKLMTLGGIETCNSINIVTVPVHLLNLLLTGRKNLEEVKLIVLFLIEKAFSSSHKSGIGFFNIKMLQIKCLMNQENVHEKNFNFFLWEMNNKKRQDLAKKLQGGTVLSCSKTDVIHFNSILLIFLYQQIIFLRINKANENMIEKCINLIDGIFSLKERCPGCIFDKFLEILS